MGYVVNKIKEGKADIKVVRGDTFKQEIKIYTEDILLYIPAEQDIVTFCIWNKFTDEEPLYTQELNHEDMTFLLTAEECGTFKYGNYVYSVKIQFADGTVDTFLSGNFTVVVAGGDK